MFGEFARDRRRPSAAVRPPPAGIAADPGLAGLLLAAPPTQRQPVLLFACVHEPLLPLTPTAGRAARPATTPTSPPTRTPATRCRRFAGAVHAPARRRAAKRCCAPAARRPTRSGAARCCCPRFGLVAAEVGPIWPTSTSAPAPGSTSCSTATSTATSRAASVGPTVDRVCCTCGTRGDVPVPDALPPDRRRPRDRSAPVAAGRRRRDALARGLRLARPDRSVRSVAGGASRSPAPRRPDVRVGDAVDRPRRQRPAARRPGTPGRHEHLGPQLPHRRAERGALRRRAGRPRGRARPVLDLLSRARSSRPNCPVPATTDSVDRTVLVLVRWRAGRRTVEHLADTHPHGYWMHWTR